jgi:pyridoxamine 5'-phosphate oxidase
VRAGRVLPKRCLPSRQRILRRMQARIESLQVLHATCWQELQRAARDREHGWRLMTLATAGEAGPDARTVVLRDVDSAAEALMFYSDSRAAKVHELSVDPRATLVLWSHTLGWQLRLRCRVEIETSGLEVSSRWARLKLTPAARDYLSPLPPGSPFGPVSVYEPDRATREHFCVLRAEVQSLDWLELHPEGHRRARFTRGQEPAGQWLAP